MWLSINAMHTATNVPECMKMHELQQVASQNQHLQCLKDYIIKVSLESRIQIPQDIRTYWTFRDDMAVIGRVIIKGRHLVAPEVQQKEAHHQLLINHMGIERTKLLACDSIYWIHMNVIENCKKNCSTCLHFQQRQPKERKINHEIPGKPWEVKGWICLL